MLPRFDSLQDYQVIIFDLDNTLYPETEYLFGAYHNISYQLSDLNHVDPEKMYSFLCKTFTEHGRKKLFDLLIDKFNLDQNILDICLNALRTYTPSKKIKLFPTAYSLIKELIFHNKKICIATNGNPIQQRNKIANIDWKGFDKYLKFFFCNETEPKPSKKCFEKIYSYYKSPLQSYVLIGDSIIDQEFAKNTEIDFIKV